MEKGEWWENIRNEIKNNSNSQITCIIISVLYAAFVDTSLLIVYHGTLMIDNKMTRQNTVYVLFKFTFDIALNLFL